MQNPEYSTHPDYSTFTAEFSSNYYIYIADVQSGASLKIAEGNFAVPHLWVAPENPVMQLSSANLSFNATLGGDNPVEQTIAVSNSGQGQLDDGPFEVANGTNSWNYTLVTTSLADTVHTLTARATDTSGNSATVSVDVNVDNSSDQPSITIIAPNGGEVWEVGTTQHIRWSTNKIDDVTIRYSTNNGQNTSVLEITVDKNKDEWLDYPWIIPDEPSRECLIYISGYFGEVPTQSASTFEIKKTQSNPNDGDIIGGCSCSSASNTQDTILMILLVVGLYPRTRKN
jgi:hypothetical protein